MRARRTACLAAVAALALAGCRDTPRRAAGSGPQVDPASLAGRMTLELWQLRPGIRLDAWASANLGDQLSGPDSTGTSWLAGWCARSISVAEVRGRPIQREVYFFPPEPPDSLELPDTAAADLARECTLGAMALSAPARDTSAKGSEEADSLGAAFGVAFGEAQRRPAGLPRSGNWSRVHHFRRNGIAIITAYSPATADSGAPRLLAVALLPAAGIAEDGSPATTEPFTPVDSMPLDSALRLARIDSALADTLLAITRQPRDTVRRPTAALVRPLLRWVRASQSLPAPRRAAALYAADAVLERAMCSHGLCEQNAAPLHAPLRAAGVAFTWSEIGGTWHFDHAWMTRARILDRDSPLGQRILLRQMKEAFDFSGTCEGGANGYRAVISNGERYLERVPESPIAAEVHYLIAEAYRDIVALVGGAGGEFGSADATAAEAPEARAMAIQHYQAAIAAGSGRLAREAWKRAWWLMAGLVPRDTRFFCASV